MTQTVLTPDGTVDITYDDKQCITITLLHAKGLQVNRLTLNYRNLEQMEKAIHEIKKKVTSNN